MTFRCATCGQETQQAPTIDPWNASRVLLSCCGLCAVEGWWRLTELAAVDGATLAAIDTADDASRRTAQIHAAFLEVRRRRSVS